MQLFHATLKTRKGLSPIPAGSYVDDIVLISYLEDQIKDMLSCLIEQTKPSGLEIRPDKCAAFFKRRPGNRWYKAKTEQEPKLVISNKGIRVYKCHEPFTYLGKSITVAGETENQAKDILKDYQELLESVIKCQLPLALKLEALESAVMSKIQHHFPNTNISEELLQEFDKALTSFLRHLFDIYTNTTVHTCYMRKQLVGLGVRKPSIVYRAT